ncbi:Inactive rhomboid 1 [Heracleum sosnowskyi]|uniref:Inactive rhomboid 1 n=1 Tax=Heracleum sosnowskyi TaxID=360622 RepID=A0AAD8GY29_9APIA|nr:Inactive rhomboid 1 [Heracleum sosnowskyi]
MEADEFGFDFKPPSLISLTPFTSSPAPRRLSSSFVPPNEPVRAAKQLSWLSFQGRLVGAEEATSAKAIGGGLGLEERMGWEMFSPMQRVLVVAVIGVAVGNCKKNQEILRLKSCVQIRDQVLSAMQEELDSLCEQVNYFKDKSDDMCQRSSGESLPGSIKYGGCGCRPCDFHQLPYDDMMGSAISEFSKWEDTFKYQSCQPEERRMSNLSDWAPSVNSTIDIQLQLDNEQDIYNLRKECEEKDAAINELSLSLDSSRLASSKRISELEDIIRRKNTLITKLKKDKKILQQKVLRLTLLSSSGRERKLPLLNDNMLYDMANTTSPSSSDSDSPSRVKHQACVPISQISKVQSSYCSSRGDQKSGQVSSSTESLRSADKLRSPQPANQKILVRKSSCSSMGDQKAEHNKTSTLFRRSTGRHHVSQPVAPLKEKSLNQNLDPAPITRSKKVMSGRNLKSQRRPPTNLNNAVPKMR